MGWKKIPFDDLAVLHKFYGGGSDGVSQKPVNLLMTPTFSGNLGKNCCRNTGDVKRNYGREHNREIGPKIREPPWTVERQRSEIPVDNLEFSTFSTGFSTRVFHRPGGKVDTARVYISVIDKE